MPLNGSGSGIESPALTPQEAVQSTLKTLLDGVLQHCVVIANRDKGTVRAVHGLRVDIRKTLAAFQIFQDFVPECERDWFLKKLNRLRKLTGAVRDRDVLVKRLVKMSSNTPTDDRCEESLHDLVRCIRKQRSQFLDPLQQKARQFLDSGSFSKHTASLLQGTAIDAYTFQGRTATADATNDFSRLSDKLRSISQRWLQSLDWKISDLESIHQFRLQTKFFRYTLEILAAQLSQNSLHDLLSVFSNLQVTLGRINDHRFAWQELRGLSRDVSKQGRRCLKKLTQDARHELKSSLTQLEELWTPAFQRQLRDLIQILLQNMKQSS